MSTGIIVVIVVAVIVVAALVTGVLRLFPDCETTPTLLTSRAGLVPVMALAQRARLMVAPAVRFASGEPARAAGVTAALAEAVMGSGWHCTRADSLGGRSECRETHALKGHRAAISAAVADWLPAVRDLWSAPAAGDPAPGWGREKGV